MGVCAMLMIPFLPWPAAASRPYILVSGVLHIVYNLLLIQTYRSGDLGETYPIARGSSPLLVTVAAALFVHERLDFIRLTGVVLVSCGILALAIKERRFSTTSVPAALATGICIAAYTVVDGMGVRLSGDYMAYTAWMFSIFLIMPVLFLLRRGAASTAASPIETIKSIAGGVISVAAYGVVIWAMQLSPMGSVSALRETSVVFAALIGRFFLAETLSVRRMVACLVIAAGAVCLK